MKFSCQANNLKKGLNIAQKAITGSASSPILNGIYLNAQDKYLTIRGSDINVSIETKVEINCDISGEVLINARLISDLMGKLQGEVIVYEEGQEVFIKNGDNNIYNMPKMNVNNYPSFPEIDVKYQIELTDEIFNDLVYMTEFACSTDESRPLFTGILLDLKGNQLTFVGTNTHRLAIKSYPIEADDFSCVIPAKIMGEIRNITSQEQESQEITLGILFNQALISFGSTKIVTRLLDGRFPDYRRVIPKTFTLSAQVNREELLKDLDRVVLFSKSNDHSTVKLNFNNNVLYVTSSGVDIGSAKEELNCQMDGNDLRIAFNAGYLTDILKHSKADKITFRLNSSLTPGIIDINDETFTYIITPVRVL